MKIAILIGEVTGRGGMETVISNTVTFFNQHTKHNMKIFVLGGSRDETWLQKINQNDYNLLCSAEESKFIRYLKCIFVAPKNIKKYNPDIILGADEKSVLYAKLISQLYLKNVKIGTWIHFSLTSINSFYKRILKKADFHLAISEGLKSEYISNGITNLSNIFLVYNPLDIKHELIKRSKEKVHFIYVGRLIYDGQKRVNDMLDSLSSVRGDWQLTIIGDGKDKERLMNLADNLGINQRISWLGWKDKPFDCITNASLLLLTSEYEGFGMVLVEAMSRGIPCISTNCPVGPSDIIENGKNGWLYPVRDNKALNVLLNKIMDGSLSLPDQENVRESVIKFDIDNFTSRIEKVFYSVLYK